MGGRDADIIDLNYKIELNVLFNNQIVSGNYSKTPFLVRRSVNAENAVRQAEKTIIFFI
jgi:hypothetical protein